MSENWSYKNLTNPTSEEFKYMDYIDDVALKVNDIRRVFINIDRKTYYSIKNNEPKVKQTEKLQKVESLLDEINKILEEKSEPIVDEDNGKYDMNIIAQNMTRDEFLIKVKNEVWCISKYGFNDSHDHCAVIMGGDCIECFKDAVKNIRFKGE